MVAETEVEKAIDILKVALARPHDEYEDLGRVTDTLLKALRLQPGQFARLRRPEERRKNFRSVAVISFERS